VARRLLEVGTQFVTVLWDEFEMVNSAWDTHYYHYELMREQLCPGFDRALSTLVLDLEERGMLDDTLIVVTTEHGRTPKLENVPGAGRGHWAQAYSTMFIGGGAAQGKVVGRTDRIAGSVQETPISPKDVLATMYYLLGIDPETLIKDRLGRPIAIAGEGKVREEVLG
jgi:arylsulfatase A-like enzyme